MKKLKSLLLATSVAFSSMLAPATAHAYSLCDFGCDFLGFVSDLGCDVSGFVGDLKCVASYFGLPMPDLNDPANYSPGSPNMNTAGMTQGGDSMWDCWEKVDQKETKCEQSTAKHEQNCHNNCDGK